MKTVVLNGSPSGENSITLQTVLFLEKHFPKAKFEIINVGQKIRHYEEDFSKAAATMEKADLILFCYPVYTFLVPAQLHRFVELIKENHVNLQGKFATQITTSKHFYDVTAHRFIQDNCDDLGLKYIRGLSADMEDLLSSKGRKEALSFFRFVRWSIKNDICEPARYSTFNGLEPTEDKENVYENSETEAGSIKTGCGTTGDPDSSADKGPGKIVVLTDNAKRENPTLSGMIRTFTQNSPCACDVIDLQELGMKGGCLGCFHCASDGTCIYKDGFTDYLRNRIQTADAVVYAFTVRDHSMGSLFKMFDDRQFCNGHRTVTMGKPVGYIISGRLHEEENLRMVLEARAEVGGNYFSGIACDEKEPEKGIWKLAKTLSYAIENHYCPPKNFYGVGGLKIFRDLIYTMQGLMREDHRFYKENGFYDFPQKKKLTIAGMYLVGTMMTNKKISKKIGGKMTEGMLMPYKKVLEKIDNSR